MLHKKDEADESAVSCVKLREFQNAFLSLLFETIGKTPTETGSAMCSVTF